MELILLQDVEKLGFKDEIVTVKNGFGRNFLIPQGKAVLATEAARKVLAENLRQRAKKDDKVIAEANAKADAINAISDQTGVTAVASTTAILDLDFDVDPGATDVKINGNVI